METLKQILADYAFFKDFEPPHLQFLTECATEVHFEPGAYILREGEEVNHFYLIGQGTVALGTIVPERGFTTLQILGAGEVLGLSWLVPPYCWHFSALVIIPTWVIALDAGRLREKCETDHEFGYVFMKRLAIVMGQRLKATRMCLSSHESVACPQL
jgi:CRP-like cAMP-binding protein